MQPSPTPPVTAGAVVEEVGGWSRWIRPVAAGLASIAVLVAGAALWEYGRQAGTDTPADPHDVLAVATAVHLGGGWWLRHHPRRGDLRWRPRIALPGGARPGLTARRSVRAFVIEVVAPAGVLGSGLVWAGATIGGWEGRILSALCGAAVPMAAFSAFQRLRRPTLVAITSAGVVAEGEAVPWERIARVHRDKEGVHLRLRDQVRYVTVCGEDRAVSNERLAHVIEYYLATPHRRIALDVNAPGPLGAVQ